MNAVARAVNISNANFTWKKPNKKHTHKKKNTSFVAVDSMHSVGLLPDT